MWQRTYSAFTDEFTIEQLWQVWSDVNQSHIWQDDVAHAQLNGTFTSGQIFAFQPKGDPKMTLSLSEVAPLYNVTDLTRFPLAQMWGRHEFIQHPNNRVEIKTTISITGALAWLWRKIVAENVVKSLPKQTACLIERVRALNK